MGFDTLPIFPLYTPGNKIQKLFMKFTTDELDKE